MGEVLGESGHHWFTLIWKNSKSVLMASPLNCIARLFKYSPQLLTFQPRVAFGSIRREPMFMILGQSGAVMLSFEENVIPQKLDCAELKQELTKEGQKIELK
jgi:hypothetical protein